MVEFHNPALKEEPIGEPAAIIVPRENESILRWIENTGRFMPYQSDTFHDNKATDELEDILDQAEEEELDGEE